MRAAWIVLFAVLAGRAVMACGDFSPKVGPARDAAPAPDCGTTGDDYADAGACAR